MQQKITPKPFSTENVEFKQSPLSQSSIQPSWKRSSYIPVKITVLIPLVPVSQQ